MKKLLAISLLLLALVLTVVACTDDPVEPVDTTAAETTGTEEPTVAPTDAEDTTAAEEPTETLAPDTTDAPDTKEEPTKAPETTKKPADEKPTEPPETEPVAPTKPINVFNAAAINNDSNMNWIESMVLSDDGSYLTITPNASDPHYYPFANVDGGRYIAIKYRTSNADGTAVQLYIGSMGTSPSDDSSMLRQSANADGQWHIAIFDTQPLIDAGIYDGSTVSYFRFDPLECDYILDENGNPYMENGVYARYPMPAGAAIDVQYIGFFHTPDAVELYEYSPVHLVTPEDLAGKATNTTTATLGDGFITLTGTGGDGWISALDAGSVADLNSYIVAIRYRTTVDVIGEVFAGSGGGATGGSSTTFSYVPDGDWHTLYVDVATLADMSGALNYIRYDYFADATDRSIDIAYIAIFNTVEEAEAYEAFINKLPEDTHEFRSDAAGVYDTVGSDVDILTSDLAQIANIVYGDGKSVYVTKTADGIAHYALAGGKFSSVTATADGTYAYTVDVLHTEGAEGFASIFVRGIQNASPEKQYYGQDGHDGDASSMGGAGIYLNVLDKGEEGLKLRINVKTYDGGYVPNITLVDIQSKTITVTDDGKTVSIIAGDELVATIKISGKKDYALDGVGADELAATAVMTLADGTEITYENACMAASHLSNVGVATRTGTLLFTSLSLMPFSSVVTPNFPEPPEHLVSDKDNYLVGEPIVITALGAGTDWVGIADRGADKTIGWYYVEPVTGQSVNFFDLASDGSGASIPALPAGDYTIYLIPSDQNLADATPIAAKDISIFDPIELNYVTDGLVSCYKGTGYSHTVWTDLVGDNDLPLDLNSDNYLTESGLHAAKTNHYFNKDIVELVNGNTFTVEILFGDFVSIGSNFNTVMNSKNDNFALFRRCAKNQLEFKFAGNTGDQRPKVDDGLNLFDNGLITITYTVGGNCCVYVDGVLVGEKASPSAMGADNLFIGHNQEAKFFETTYKSIRFYDRALTADEVLANAQADGVAQ